MQYYIWLLNVVTLALVLLAVTSAQTILVPAGLEENDLIEWKGTISTQSRPAYFFINARNSNGDVYSLIKLQIQGARFRIKSQTGIYTREVEEHSKLSYCPLGRNIAAPGKSFRIIARLKKDLTRDSIMVYYNGNLTFTQSLLDESPSFKGITQIRVYGSANTEVLRILTTQNLNAEMRASQCGSITSGIDVPTFCPEPKTRSGYSNCRIIGGRATKPAQNPWQVSIRKKPAFVNNNNPHVCGGTLVHDSWVLTAAHCFLSFSAKSIGRMTVRVGDYYNRDDEMFSNDRNAENSEDIDLEEVIRHLSYEGYPAASYDIALVKLKRPVTFGRFIRPACLPKASNEFFSGEECGVSGWGASNESQYVADYPACLQGATVEIKSYENCDTSYGNTFINDIMLCAGSRCTDTCQGDSGGPLICRRSNGKYVLWGITSWGIGCGDDSKSGVYTRVSTFLRWMYVQMMLYPNDQQVVDLIRRRKIKETNCHYGP